MSSLQVDNANSRPASAEIEKTENNNLQAKAPQDTSRAASAKSQKSKKTNLEVPQDKSRPASAKSDKSKKSRPASAKSNRSTRSKSPQPPKHAEKSPSRAKEVDRSIASFSYYHRLSHSHEKGSDNDLSFKSGRRSRSSRKERKKSPERVESYYEATSNPPTESALPRKASSILKTRRSIRSVSRKSIIEVQGSSRETSSECEFFLTCLGYALGYGNVLRFPYICFLYGGGDFLIPYFAALILIGVPVLMLELWIGQYAGKSIIQAWDFCPLLRGVGWGMVIISLFISVYYNVYMTWVLYYLFHSFTTNLPWADCGNEWNSNGCFSTDESSAATADDDDQLSSNASNGNQSSIAGSLGFAVSAEEFFHNSVIEISSGVSDLIGVRWLIVGLIALSWFIVFLCIFKGIKSSGKFLFVTSMVSWIFLTILLIFSVLLPGALLGLLHLFVPDFSNLLSLNLWGQACLQVFYSLGIGFGGWITMASYRKFHSGILKYVYIVPCISALFSMMSAVIVFSVLGFMAEKADMDVDEIVTAGPGVGLVTLSELVTELPMPMVWAILLFIVLILIGLNSQIVLAETVISGLYDLRPSQNKGLRIFFVFDFCLFCILVTASVFATRAAMYFLLLMDWYVAIFSAVLFVFFECIAISFIYGLKRLYSDIEYMIGFQPVVLWKLLFALITPILLLFLIGTSLGFLDYPTYGDYEYPTGGIIAGWVMGWISVLPIPVCFIYYVLKGKGSCAKKFSEAASPADTWKPSESAKEPPESGCLCCTKKSTAVYPQGSRVSLKRTASRRSMKSASRRSIKSLSRKSLKSASQRSVKRGKSPSPAKTPATPKSGASPVPPKSSPSPSSAKPPATPKSGASPVPPKSSPSPGPAKPSPTPSTPKSGPSPGPAKSTPSSGTAKKSRSSAASKKTPSPKP